MELIKFVLLYIGIIILTSFGVLTCATNTMIECKNEPNTYVFNEEQCPKYVSKEEIEEIIKKTCREGIK